MCPHHEEGYCHSCGIPLSLSDAEGSLEDYCAYCTDEDGNLKMRDEIKQHVADWLQSWQPRITGEQVIRRAEHYMKAMLLWAETGAGAGEVKRP